MGYKYCWFELSYVEAGLVLVLLVAIPFLITMIILYIIYGGSCWSSSISCYEICFDSSSASKSNEIAAKVKIISSNSNEILNSRKRRSVSFPYVGALMEPFHSDDDEEVLKCIVVVLTQNLVLTTSTCLNQQSQERARLRFFSDHWSQGGEIRKIKKVLVSNEEETLQSKPVVLQLTKNILAQPVELANGEAITNTTGLTILTWSSDFGIPLQNRFKYKKLKREEVELLASSQCPQIFGNAISDLVCRKETRGNCESLNVHSPLFRGGKLVAIHVGTYCDWKEHEAISYYQTIDQHLNWLKRIRFIGG